MLFRGMIAKHTRLWCCSLTANQEHSRGQATLPGRALPVFFDFFDLLPSVFLKQEILLPAGTGLTADWSSGPPVLSGLLPLRHTPE